MSNIEKLYKLAGIKKKYCGWLDMGDLDTQYQYVMCDTLEEWQDAVDFSRTSYSADENDKNWRKPEIKYPPFTPEKQLGLIKWVALNFSQNSILHIDRWTRGKVRFALDKEKYAETYYESDYAYGVTDFSQALAGLIIEIWNDLTDEQKQQIKEILKAGNNDN